MRTFFFAALLILIATGARPETALADDDTNRINLGVNLNYGLFPSENISFDTPGFGLEVSVRILDWLEIAADGDYMLSANYYRGSPGGYIDVDRRVWTTSLHSRLIIPEIKSIKVYVVAGGGYQNVQSTGEQMIWYHDYDEGNVVEELNEIKSTDESFGWVLGAGAEVDWFVNVFLEPRFMLADSHYFTVSGGVRVPVF